MSALAPQADHATYPRRATRARPIRRPAIAHVEAPQGALETVSEPSDDSGRLMVLLFVFLVTPLVVVVALLGAAAIDTWWALAGAVAVHFLTTAVVFVAVAYLMSGHLPRLPSRGRT